MAAARHVILSGRPGWHGARLRAALERRGAPAVFARLEDCRLELAAPAPRVSVPGFDGAPPAGAFVREVPGGSLEEVIYYLDVLHGLEAMGVPVYNDAGAIERSVDKVRASFLFALHGVPTPRTFVARDLRAARAVLRAWLERDGRVVAKPIFGSQGQDLQLLTRDAPHLDLDAGRGVCYLQEYVAPEAGPSRDWRVLVIGDRAAAAMRREGAGWISNLGQGGKGAAAALTPELARLAERAAAAVGMAYAGVDLLRGRDGRLWVTEVNSIPAWRGLQQAAGADVSGWLADGYLAHCRRGALRPAA